MSFWTKNIEKKQRTFIFIRMIVSFLFKASLVSIIGLLSFSASFGDQEELPKESDNANMEQYEIMGSGRLLGTKSFSDGTRAFDVFCTTMYKHKKKEYKKEDFDSEGWPIMGFQEPEKLDNTFSSEKFTIKTYWGDPFHHELNNYFFFYYNEKLVGRILISPFKIKDGEDSWVSDEPKFIYMEFASEFFLTADSSGELFKSSNIRNDALPIFFYYMTEEDRNTMKKIKNQYNGPLDSAKEKSARLDYISKVSSEKEMVFKEYFFQKNSLSFVFWESDYISCFRRNGKYIIIIRAKK